MVEVFDEHTQSWIQYTDQADVESACLAENKRRFHQASDTPFLVSPLYNLIGPLANTPVAEYILEHGALPDTVDRSGIDPYALKLLPHLKYHSPLPGPIPLSIPTETHIAGWKRAQEATSSSGFGGLHFGHFIAGTSSRIISDFEATMANIPYASGYSPLRWRYAVDMMIEKQKGNF